MTSGKAQEAAGEYIDKDYWGDEGVHLFLARDPERERDFLAGYAQGQHDLLEAIENDLPSEPIYRLGIGAITDIKVRLSDIKSRVKNE